MSKVLEIENLTKYYGKTKGVEKLNLSLNEGEIFGFIGPNGSGKSTTIRSIMKLINYDGKIERTDSIGYLPCEVNLYSNYKISELFEFHQKIYKKDMNKKINYLCEQLSINKEKKISELSTGNLKKVAIVLSLAHDPKLIIMDEATSGLDPIIQENFYNILKEEKEKGNTILFSSHNLNEVKKIADRIGIIKDGNLIDIKNVDEMVNDEVHYITIYTDDEKLINKYMSLYDGKKIQLSYKEDINKLIQELSKYKIKKLLIEEASLEDIFMLYYK